MHLVGYFLVTAVVLAISTLASGRCKFPKTWKGRWYQSGLGEIIISSSFIDQKGMCVDHARDLYVIENEDDHCFRCLLLMKHHRNIIQYKETFCLAGDSLKNICSQIQVEAPLYTLVREPTAPIQCPFEEAYKFTYSDGLFHHCPEQTSSLKPCVEGTRVQAEFRHCSQYAQFNNQDLQLECLGTWKEGSDFYLYGRFLNADNMLDTYRCFKYEHFGPDLFISMSVDGTCRGLRSAKDGPLVVTGWKDPYGWLQASCSFPDWLDASTTWRSMANDEVYQLEAGSKSLLIQHRNQHGRLTPRSRLRCVHVAVAMETVIQLVSFSTHDCSSSYQCVTLRKLHDNAIYVHLGATHDVNEDDICTEDIGSSSMSVSSRSIDNGGQVVIRSDASPSSCPLSGTYTRSQHGHLSCDYTLAVGCGRPSLLHLNGTCSNRSIAVTVQCLASWHTEQTYFVILQHGHDVTCISAQPRQGQHGGLEISNCRGTLRGGERGGGAEQVPGLEGTFHRTGACIPGADIPDPITYHTTSSSSIGDLSSLQPQTTSRSVIPLPDHTPTESNNNNNNNNNNNHGDHSVTVDTSDESSSSETKEQQYKHVDKSEREKEGREQHSGHQSDDKFKDAIDSGDSESGATHVVDHPLARVLMVAVTLASVLFARR